MFFPAILLQLPVSESQGDNVFHLLLSSDPVVKVTLLILVAFSILSWSIIFFKFLQLRKAKKTMGRFSEQFEQSESIDTLLTQSATREGNPLYEIFSSGVYDILRYRQAQAKDPSRTPKLKIEAVRRSVRRSIGDEIAKLEQFTSFLATTASSSPFIGLFGTVWGILTAFWAIGKSGSTSLATVGPFIAESLIATAVGLATAVPAYIAYNYFLGKIRYLIRVLEDFSEDLVYRIEKEYF